VETKKYTVEELMKEAIKESYKSISEHTNKTDPLVGAIIATEDGVILGTAHRGELREGEHCEYTLIERKLRDKNLKNCVLYVTLEPCTDESRNNSEGKPSLKRGCSTHIKRARLSKVYIGIEDANPKVAKQGIQFLIANKVEVEMFPEDLADTIRKENAQFIKEKEEEAKQIKKEKISRKKSFLEQPTPGTNISNFSGKAVQKFITEAKMPFAYPSDDFVSWCNQFGLIEKNNEEEFIPTALGILLFGESSELSFPQSVFKIEINYDGKEPEIRDFVGPLVLQLPQLIDFVRDKAIKFTIDRSKGRREERADFPFEIIREAIANAIIHRDYSIRGATNYMYIDTNKIIVRSPGGPEPPVLMDMLKELRAPSVSRNPEIMFVFNQMKLAEQRGVGLRDMKKLPSKGFPLPVFELKAGNIEVAFGRTKEFIAERAGLDNLSALSEDDKNIIIFIQERKEIATGELVEHFNLHSKAAQRKLFNLVGKGLLMKTGEKRGTRYAINPDIKL